ncbi:hypothetical protein HN240_18740, partial [Acinetobacter baumannii]|nr:hypothetical protein [Acinetobacter baumannii]
FEDISEEEYERRVAHLNAVDLSNVREEEDTTDRAGEVACGSGGCEVNFA